jgi:hypothetical protein
MVEVTATLEVPCGPEALFAEVESLDGFPEWLSIVPRVDRERSAGVADGEVVRDAVPGAGGRIGAESGDDRPAWTVELRGRIGPLARSKRLRMVRVACEPPRSVRFERRELDGRVHAPWVMEAEVASTEVGSRLTMRLRYGGSFGGALIERLLREEIEVSRSRLRARVLARATGER